MGNPSTGSLTQRGMYPEDQPSRWHSGQGLWSKVARKDWNDWKWQLRNRITDLEGLSALLEPSAAEREGCRLAKTRMAFAVTPYFFNLIDRDNPNCPIRRQVIPNAAELDVQSCERVDPVGEETTMPVPGLVHRYPDRVLFLVTDRCASYCRYCTRSRMVSDARGYHFHPQFEQALDYIAGTPQVRDVLISGGDALLLSDSKLDYLLGRLRAIKHVEFVRIGSRVPVFMPQRITAELCRVFKKHGPLWLSIHVNHPRECTRELAKACERLAYAGVVLGNQSVLLKGINDTVDVQRSLVHRLLQMRVRPYYLYQCDLITGSGHFRTDVRTGMDIIHGLRGYTSGYAVPQFVIDAPGGGGKVPVNPSYIEQLDDQAVLLRNFKGDAYAYPQPGACQ